jgi:predicted acylesterase/phospholipase RssA
MNLVIGGGEIKGFKFLGALDRILQTHESLFPLFQTFSGTSIGAVLCFLFSLGLTPRSLLNPILREITSFQLGRPEFTNLRNKFGLFSIEKIIDSAFKVIPEVEKTLTFKQHFESTNRFLTFTTTSKGGTIYLNHETYPNMTIYQGLCMTCDIPILFGYQTFENKVYLDGGMRCDCPIDFALSKFQGKFLVLRIHNDFEFNENIGFFPYLVDILMIMLSTTKIEERDNIL